MTTYQWEMPVVQPVRIRTRGKGWLSQTWSWLGQSRAWELVDNYRCEVYGQPVLIPAGFRTDFASVPRVLWPIMSPTGILLIPGLLHDFYYRHHFLLDPNRNHVFGLLGRAWGDEMLRAISIAVNGGMPLSAGVAWTALRSAGWIAWNNARRKDFDRGAKIDLINGYE